LDQKAPDAFRTISEVADELDLPQHVLRFWESRFHEIRPMKRGGGRRYYRPTDVDLLRGILHLLYGEGYTIRGVQRILREQGVKFVEAVWREGAPQPPHGPADIEDAASSPDETPVLAERAGLLSRLIGRDLNEAEVAPARSERPMSSAAVPAVDVSVRIEPAPEFLPVPPPAPVVQIRHAGSSGTGLSSEEAGRLHAALYELGECRKLLAAAITRTDRAA